MGGTSTTLGERIRELRLAAGLAQSDVRGIHRTHLGALERGDRTCTIETLEKLAKALRCEVVDFFTAGPGSPDTPQGRLGQNISVIAAGATEEEMERFHDLAIVYFRRTPARTKRKRRSH